MLINHVISVAVLIATVAGVLLTQKFYMSKMKQADLKFNALQIRSRILATTSDAGAWNAMVADSGVGKCNTSLECFFKGDDCYKNFTNSNKWSEDKTISCIYDLGGYNLFFDGSKSTSGFDLSGLPCDSFNELAPDGYCIFKPIVQWRSTCASSPCPNTDIEFKINIQHIGSNIPLNTSQLSLIWEQND